MFYKLVLAGMLSVGISSAVNASVCDIDNAEVTSVFQWSDGHIFVVFDKDIGCGCYMKNRVGFHKNDNEKFYMSAALTALTTGNKVRIRADNVDGTCPVHGNTPKLITFQISK